MRKLATVIVVLAALGAGITWAQSPPPDGAFVRDADGNGWIVHGGTRYPISFREDDGTLGGLTEGPAVGTVGDYLDRTAPPPLPAAPGIGQPVAVERPDGTRLVVTANSITDPSPSTNQFNTPDGRWVLVEWTVVNEGGRDVNINPFYFRLRTADGFLIEPGNHAGHREPRLPLGVVGPGQTVRGFIAYDVPAGQRVTAAIFQPVGSAQIVIAEIP